MTDNVSINSNSNSNSNGIGNSGSNREVRKSLFEEVFLFLEIGMPSVIVQFLLFFQWTLTTMFLGESSATELTAIALASLSANLVGMAVIFGILSALDTLAPQAYGMHNYREIGLLAIRSMWILMWTIPFIFILWWKAEDILLYFHQPAIASRYAAIWLRFYGLSIPAIIIFETMKRFYAAQEIVMPFVYISFICLVLHFLFLVLLIGTFGFTGAALAHVFTNWTSVILMYLYLGWWKQIHIPGSFFTFEELIHPQSRNRILNEAISFDKIKIFLKLGLPGIFSMSEWWFWELTTFMIGRLGQNQLAAHAIAYSVIPLCFMLSIGIGVGTTVRMGVLLANDDVKMAWKVAITSVLLTALGTGAIIALLMIYRVEIILLFTNDHQVFEITNQIWPLVCVYIMQMGLMGVQTGVLKGLGLQFRLSVVFIFTLFILGIPVVFVSLDYGFYFIWISLPLLYILLNLLMFFSYCCANWERVALEIQQNSQNHIPVPTG